MPFELLTLDCQVLVSKLLFAVIATYKFNNGEGLRARNVFELCYAVSHTVRKKQVGNKDDITEH